ncbi:MAG: thiamine diphosphokinase [Spirochaetaceae bacterium]|jgi:thiamine pyrophosphokinase|nr:thiamine diphosphokinase [Spirochaetaceae bacterium]
MNGLAFIGGEGPCVDLCVRLAGEADLIAAADSGLICAENAQIRPDWIVGDMDSLDDVSRLDKYPPDHVIRFPADKDFTDTELVINLLFEKSCDNITIAGGGGGRLDHILAIAALFERERAPKRWFTAREKIFFVFNEFYYHTKKNSIVSVFPLGNGPWRAQSSGLKWPLHAAAWERGFFGVSNVTETGEIIIKVSMGRFLIIITE